MNRLSLQRKFLIVFICLIALPVILLTLLQNVVVHRRVQAQLIENTRLVGSRYVSQLDAVINAVMPVLSQTSSNTNLRHLVSGSDSGELNGSTYLAFRDFKDELNVYLNAAGMNVFAICMANTDHIFMQIGKEYLAYDYSIPLDSIDWYAEAVNLHGKPYWQGLTTETTTGGRTYKLFSVSCALFDEKTQGIVGALRMSFRAEQIFPQPDEGEGLLIFVKDGCCYAGNGVSEKLSEEVWKLKNGNKRTAAVIDGVEYLLITVPEGQHGWSAIYAAPYGSIRESLRNTGLMFACVMAVSGTMMVIFLRQIQKKMLRPINEAAAFINDNTESQVLVTSDRQGYPELVLMNKQMASLVQGRRNALESLRQENLRSDQYRFKSLQAQINPHFLYNTLNSIKVLAEMGRVRDVSGVIVNLVHLLHACMDRSGAFVTAGQELQTLKNYVEIQKVIYGTSVRFEYRINETLLDCRVPNFILQPIVENALQHGLDLSKQDGGITVSLIGDGDDIAFTVADNGMGIDEDRIKEIESIMNSDEAGSHIGIRSVHQRIRLSCGEAYGVEIHSTPNVGTMFTLRLPRKT